MAVVIEMPKLGLSMQEGTVARWLFKEGDEVKKGEAVCEVSTEKITNVVESPIDGVLLKIKVSEGEVVPILTPLGIIGEEGEEIEEKSETKVEEKSINEVEIKAKTVQKSDNSINEASPVAIEYAKNAGVDINQLSGTGFKGRILKRDVKNYLRENNLEVLKEEDYGTEMISPVAHKLLKLAGVDESKIQGTGPKGRVLKKDVMAYLKANNLESSIVATKTEEIPNIKISPVAEKLAKEANVNPYEITGTGPGGRVMKADVERYIKARTEKVEVMATKPELTTKREKASKRRKIIADRMYQSLQTTAQTTLSTSVDVTELMKLYKSINNQLDGKLNLTAVFVKALTETIKDFPEFNAYYIDEEIQYNEKINLGIAVDTADGLIVPVIGDAGSKKLTQLSKELKELAHKARNNQLTLDDLSNGTITISNLGMFDIDVFTPILNSPESAILGIGRIKEVPMVKNGGIYIGQEMVLSITIDHRIIDGAPAARFLKSLKTLLENPEELLLN